MGALASRHSVMGPLAHIIGAGLAGLSAAVALAKGGARVAVYEAAPEAGGRCRSYYDATFGAVIDNGNHLVLSGNSAVAAYLKTLNAEHEMPRAETPDFDFADYGSGERWRLRLSAGRLPLWLLDPARRVPGTRARDYLPAVRLLMARRGSFAAPSLSGSPLLYRRLWHPLMLAALNTDPAEGSARLAGAIMRNTLLKGGAACRPMIARGGLSAAFIDPAIAFIRSRGGSIAMSSPLRGLELRERRVAALDFGASGAVSVAPGDAVILAVPPWTAAGLVPHLSAPSEFRSIVNAHFRIAPPPGAPAITGVVNAAAEWIFAFPDRLSVTISGADRFNNVPKEQLAADLWREVAAIMNLNGNLPPWRIIKEKRATFAATPAQDTKRPGAATAWDNLFLAGDWTQTGLPATIEGAIRSGERAAKLAKRRLRPRRRDDGLRQEPSAQERRAA